MGERKTHSLFKEVGRKFRFDQKGGTKRSKSVYVDECNGFRTD